MYKEILDQFLAYLLKFSDNKLPHYHKGMEMKFSSEEELSLACDIKNLLQKGVIMES